MASVGSCDGRFTFGPAIFERVREMPPRHALELFVIPGSFAVCRLPAGSPIPPWAQGGPLTSITRTNDELSVVCENGRVPDGIVSERGFAAIRVAGTLAPELVGVLESLAVPLADAGVPILAIGTYDTDYVLVRGTDLARALDALVAAGHRVSRD
jgi:hypothetical protein